MAKGLYQPSAATSSLSRITYAVSTTGNALFNATVGTSDSPDYTNATDKAAAVAQNAILSPLSEEEVV